MLIKTVGTTFIRGLPDEAESHGRGGGEDVEAEREVRTQDGHCEVPGLTTLPDDYLPRTTYMPARSAEEYEPRTPRPRVNWCQEGEDEPRKGDGLLPPHQPPDDWAARRTHPDHRHSAQGGSRPVHTTVTTASRNIGDLPDFAALSVSIVTDFPANTTGAGEMNLFVARRLPILANDCDGHIRSALGTRALRLGRLPTLYADLWYDACIAHLPTASDAPAP